MIAHSLKPLVSIGRVLSLKDMHSLPMLVFFGVLHSQSGCVHNGCSKYHRLGGLLMEMSILPPFAILGSRFSGDKWNAFKKKISLPMLGHRNRILQNCQRHASRTCSIHVMATFHVSTQPQCWCRFDFRRRPTDTVTDGGRTEFDTDWCRPLCEIYISYGHM